MTEKEIFFNTIPNKTGPKGGNYPQPTLWTPAILNYMGGIIDNANFNICLRNAPSGRRYHPQITFANCNKEFMDWLVEHFGGFYMPYNHGDDYQSYRWRASGFRATYIANVLLQYVRIKKVQCMIFQEFGLTYKAAEINFKKREELFYKNKALTPMGVRNSKRLPEHRGLFDYTEDDINQSMPDTTGFFDEFLNSLLDGKKE